MIAFAFAGLARLILAFSEPQSPEPLPTPLPTAANEQSSSTAAVSIPTETPVVGPEPKHDHKTRQRHHPSKESFNDPMIWFTGVLAFAALVQLVVMAIQSRHMRRGLLVTMEAARAAQDSALIAKRSVELAEQNTAITERAVILLESIKAEPSLGVSSWHLNPLTILVFTLKNYGATVAHNVTVKGAVTCFSTGLDLHGAQGVTIAPQGGNQWITSSLISKVRQDQFEKLNSMDPNLLAYRVEVTYSDAFGKSHRYTAEGQYIAVLKSFVTGSSTSD